MHGLISALAFQKKVGLIASISLIATPRVQKMNKLLSLTTFNQHVFSMIVPSFKKALIKSLTLKRRNKLLFMLVH